MIDTGVSQNKQAARPRGMKRLVAVMLVAGTATLAFSAWGLGQGDGPGPGMHRGPGMEMGMGGHGFMGGPPMGPEHLGRMVDRMLDGLKATDAQRTQIKEIVRLAAVDLKAQHEGGKATRERGLQVFGAPTIDAGAAEQLRQQMMGRRDASSKRMLQAMLDIGNVLTPEQRAKATERIRLEGDRTQERHDRMRRDRPDARPGAPRPEGPRG